jgi:hypothetical protein
MANKTARTNGSRRRAPARKTVGASKTRRAPDPRYWKKALERNLIREGYSRAEAKELVAISAA